MLSKCIKMPKYSFKRNLFFAIWGGPWLILAWHHVGRTTHHVGCTTHFVSCALHIMSAIQSMTRNILSTSSSKFFQVFCHFLGWKKSFFENCSKLPKIHFRTIKILFFSRFSAITRVAGCFRPNLENSRFFFLTLPL